MASYTEIYDLASDAGLRNKVAVALQVAAEAIRAEPDVTANHAARLKFALRVYHAPDGLAQQVLRSLLAQAVVATPNATRAQILTVSDSSIQNSVNAALNLFADGS